MSAHRERAQLDAARNVAAAAVRWRRIRRAAWRPTPIGAPTEGPVATRAQELEAQHALDAAIDALEGLL